MCLGTPASGPRAPQRLLLAAGRRRRPPRGRAAGHRPVRARTAATRSRAIIDYFVDEYARGRTPNPCIHCNSRIKFGRLIARADSTGRRATSPRGITRGIVDATAAGHRAGVARGKDQSYALFAVRREHVWADAAAHRRDRRQGRGPRRSRAALGLTVHDKPDSQEICFVPDDDYAELPARRAAARRSRPGEIVDSAGKVARAARGLGRFTIGQRRGLRVAAGVPMYVTRIDPATATVTIGPKDAVLSRRLAARGSQLALRSAQRTLRGDRADPLQPRGAPGHVASPARRRSTWSSTTPSPPSRPARRPSCTRGSDCSAAAGSSPVENRFARLGRDPQGKFIRLFRATSTVRHHSAPYGTAGNRGARLGTAGHGWAPYGTVGNDTERFTTGPESLRWWRTASSALLPRFAPC